MSDHHARRRAYTYSRHRLQGFDYTSPDHAYFLTICARDRCTPFTDESLAQRVIADLHWLRRERAVRLHAYCLMPDHLHLLLQLGSPAWTVGSVIATFKKSTTGYSWQRGHKGRLWQERFYDHVVRRREDGQRMAAYILANPVRAGLVDDADAWPWSGMPDAL